MLAPMRPRSLPGSEQPRSPKVALSSHVPPPASERRRRNLPQPPHAFHAGGRAQASRRRLRAARLAVFDLPRDTMKRSRRTFLQLTAGAAALPALSRFASAQAYPARPVRMIIGYPPGGSADITARLTGQWLSE